ncbi:MAG: nucleotidyltransferase domain-containing protein [Methanomicrobia archaeon]|nr:nucleotidyltransferase domain-containing protein [Methanomicrobia archaeon]
MDERVTKKIKKDLEFLFDKILGIVIFGSRAKEEGTERSDIDVCIVAPNEDSSKIFKETLSLNYDIKIFELMPLYLKMEVIENHKILHAKDIYELYEYFYFFRKLWDDQKYRQKLSKEEALHIFG